MVYRWHRKGFHFSQWCFQPSLCLNFLWNGLNRKVQYWQIWTHQIFVLTSPDSHFALFDIIVDEKYYCTYFQYLCILYNSNWCQCLSQNWHTIIFPFFNLGFLFLYIFSIAANYTKWLLTKKKKEKKKEPVRSSCMFYTKKCITHCSFVNVGCVCLGCVCICKYLQTRATWKNSSNRGHTPKHGRLTFCYYGRMMEMV